MAFQRITKVLKIGIIFVIPFYFQDFIKKGINITVFDYSIFLTTFKILSFRINVIIFIIRNKNEPFCNAPHLSRAALRKSGKKVCFRGLRESVMPG